MPLCFHLMTCRAWITVVTVEKTRARGKHPDGVRDATAGRPAPRSNYSTIAAAAPRSGTTFSTGSMMRSICAAKPRRAALFLEVLVPIVGPADARHDVAKASLGMIARTPARLISERAVRRRSCSVPGGDRKCDPIPGSDR